MTRRNAAAGHARRSLAIALALSAPWACIDATDVELLEITGSGVLRGQVFLDLDGSSTFSAADSVLEDALVAIVTSSTADLVETSVTDSLGIFRIDDVPVGSYRIVLDSTVLGDSLLSVGAAAPITVGPGDTTDIQLGARFESVTIQEALGAPLGRRVFTSGIALNSRLNFGDGQVHFRGRGAFLRGLSVNRGSLSPGDSVRLLGRVVEDNGRPALANVSFFVLIPNAQIVAPIEIAGGDAATADSGAVDAALVRIRSAEISDTSTTVDGNFRFWAHDASDSVEIVIRDFLVPTIATTLFRPDTTVRIRQTTGLLSPVQGGGGGVRWQIFPRDGLDITLETKFADLSVTTAFDTTEAMTGDTVEAVVTVRNAGPVTATSFEVRDTIPTGLSFLEASTTAGVYDDVGGVWSLTSLAAGVADTLRIEFEVTVTPPTTVTNVAEVGPPLREVDPNATNNGAAAGLTIPEPPPPPGAEAPSAGTRRD